MSEDKPTQADLLELVGDAAPELEQAHEEAAHAGEAGMAESEIISDTVDQIADMIVDGLTESPNAAAGMLSGETKFYTKSDIKGQIQDAVEEKHNDGKPALDEFVEDRLDNVLTVKTTDHKQGAEYIWDFGTFKVETSSGQDGRGHFRFDQFREFILESGNVNVAPPTKHHRGGEEWRDFMINIMDERGETRESTGPRTEAVEALQRRIRKTTGYGTAESALNHSGVWLVAESVEIPEWWSGLTDLAPQDDRDTPEDAIEEVRVHEDEIKKVIEDAEISRSALYHELNARVLTVPWADGASTTVWVNGGNERFWLLSPDAGLPDTYVPDAHASVEVFGEYGLAEGDEEAEGVEESGPSPAADGATEAKSATDGGFDSVGDVQ